MCRARISSKKQLDNNMKLALHTKRFNDHQVNNPIIKKHSELITLA